MLANRLKWAIIAFGIALFGLLMHEFGHAIVICIFGGRITKVVFISGIQVYPYFSMVEWNGLFGYLDYKTPSEIVHSKINGLIYFMGSGATALSALAISLVLQFCFEGTWRKTLLLLAGLWPLDIITYSIFPILGLPHWIILGGRLPEPLHGAIRMGVSATGYYLFLGMYSICNYYLIYRVFKLPR
jgi:hypothetical protein